MLKHVLYIEDEESDAFLLKHSFQQIGIQDPFQLITDGEQAIAYLSGQGPYADQQRFPIPCLILLDLNLPRGRNSRSWKLCGSLNNSSS